VAHEIHTIEEVACVPLAYGGWHPCVDIQTSRWLCAPATFASVDKRVGLTKTRGNRQMKASSFAIAIGMGFALGGSVLAASGEVEVEACNSGEMQSLAHTPSQSVGTFKLFGRVRTMPAGGVFDMMSSQCFGAWSAIDGSFSTWGHCEYVGSGGDKVLLRFTRMSGEKGRYEFIGGTGKFSGLTGTAEYTAVRVPQIPGALNVCTEAKWRYSLPN
jgi:hypothetical protein